MERCDQCKQPFIKEFLFKVNKELKLCIKCIEIHEQDRCRNCKKMLVESMSNQFGDYCPECY